MNIIIDSSYHYLMLIMMMLLCPWHPSTSTHSQRSCPSVGKTGSDWFSLSSLPQDLPKTPLDKETEARKVLVRAPNHMRVKRTRA